MIRILYLSFLLGLGMINSSCNLGHDQTELIPIEDFFAKPERSNFSLSPDGKRIAYIGVNDHCKNIFILDLENSRASKQLTYQDNMNVQYFFWSSDEQIVYVNTQSNRDSLRLYAISTVTEKSIALLPVTKSKIRWVQPQQVHKGFLLAALNERDSSLFDLYRIKLDGSGKELVSENPGSVSSWYASPDGKVRLALKSDSVRETVLYRADEQAPFKEVGVSDFHSMIQPLGFVGNSTTTIYALSNQNRDKLSLVEYDLDAAKEIRVIFSNKEVDMEGKGYNPISKEMLFTGYTVDKATKHYFNKKLKGYMDRLAKKFPTSNLDILAIDSSLSKIVLKAQTDNNSGAIYYFDALDDKVKLLSENNPKLHDKVLAEKEPVSFQSRDGYTLNGYLTYPTRTSERTNLPVVVLVHDGPGKREQMDYDAEVQFLANRGYLVFQLNYRGSLGFGKEFWMAGFKEWGGKIQTDMIDGVTWLIHEDIVDKDRVAIMGTGFGGYAALSGVTFNSSFYKCAIAMSGYTNLFTYFREIPPYYKQYVQLYYSIIGNPNRESELFKAISPLFHADKVKRPVLFAQGGKDRFSSVNDANQFVQRLKNNNIPVKYIYKEEEGRRFKNEENIVLYYQEVEKFLANNL